MGKKVTLTITVEFDEDESDDFIESIKNTLREEEQPDEEEKRPTKKTRSSRKPTESL
jgi:hypothetical protein